MQRGQYELLVDDMAGGPTRPRPPGRTRLPLGAGGGGGGAPAYRAVRWARCTVCMRKHLRPIGRKQRLRTQQSPCCGARMYVVTAKRWR